MAVKTHPAYVQKYLVLSAHMLQEDLRDALENKLKTLPSPIDARLLASKEPNWGLIRDGEKFWIVLYNGIEVAVFFRRQTIAIQPEPFSPLTALPSRRLKTEEEAWMRISLLDGKSALKQTQFYSGQYQQALDRIKELEGLILTQEVELEQLREATLPPKEDEVNDDN